MDFKIGHKFSTKTSGVATIKENLGGGWFRIVFEDGYEKITSRRSIEGKEIKNPYARTVAGVGFVGEGIPTSENGVNLREYRLWLSVINRCYRPNRTVQNSYEDKTVAEVWHNYQNFAAWCRSNKGFYIEGYELDKDLLVAGNKVYGPDTCCFIPGILNRTLISYSSDNGISYTEKGKWKLNYYIAGTRQRAAKHFRSLDAAKLFYKENRYNLLRTILVQEIENLDDNVVARLKDFI